MATEQHFTIDKELLVGVKPYEKNIINGEALQVAYNVEVTPHGLIEVSPFTLPFSALPETFSFPFPQLFFGKSVTLLVYATSIYEIDTSAGVGSWTCTKLTVYDTYTGVEQDFDAGTEPWHFVDLEDFWYLICPTWILFKTHEAAFFTEGTDVVRATNVLPCKTGTYHRGRILLGGFTQDEFWNSTWGSFWTHYLPDVGGFNPAQNRLIDAPGERYVLWSSIGGGDFPLALIYPDIYETGIYQNTDGYSSTDPFILHALRKGELGWIPLPFQGPVLALRPLGNNVVAYCENGVALLKKVSDPIPTYGVEVLLRTGIVDRGGVGGNDSEHVFVDQVGEVYSLSEGGGLKSLGYVDEFNQRVSYQFMVNMIELGNRRKFYISSHGMTYLLSPNGMSQQLCNPNLTSCVLTESTLVGISSAYSNVLSDYVYIMTEPFDMNYRGLKVIRRLQLGITFNNYSDLSPTVIIYSRENVTDDYTVSDTFTISDEGIVEDIQTEGTDFKILLRMVTTTAGHTGYKDFSLKYIQVWYQITDRRFLRGI